MELMTVINTEQSPCFYCAAVIFPLSPGPSSPLSWPDETLQQAEANLEICIWERVAALSWGFGECYSVFQKQH